MRCQAVDAATLWRHQRPLPTLPHCLPQAYEGLQTAQKLRQEYLFIPAKASRASLWGCFGKALLQL